MDCAQFRSVVSFVDSLVHSAHDRRSRMLLKVNVGEPSLAPVPRKSPIYFSICSILDLESDVTQSSPSSGKLRVPTC